MANYNNERMSDDCVPNDYSCFLWREIVKAVYIEDVADAFEATMDTWTQFLNTETGEFVSLPDSDMFCDWTEDDEKLAEEIDASDAYVRLPSQYELREYNIMEDFADQVTNRHKAGILFRALNGRKPFRRFKDAINALGLADAYYAFRFHAFCAAAARWCRDNEIPYTFKDTKNGFSAGS